MKLSRLERWMLSNQYRILEMLDEENAASHRYAQEALNSGYEICYGWLCEHVYEEGEGLSEDDCRYVLDVMKMHEFLQRAYDGLDDKSGIDARDVIFHGFDGNNETSYMGFARFFCERQDAFKHLRKGSDGFNSHMPTYDIYSRMMTSWKQSKDKYNLTKDDLIRITQAAIHPDSR
jgi:uncharacterized protein YfbU (UPF0304 family)